MAKVRLKSGTKNARDGRADIHRATPRHDQANPRKEQEIRPATIKPKGYPSKKA